MINPYAAKDSRNIEAIKGLVKASGTHYLASEIAPVANINSNSNKCAYFYDVENNRFYIAEYSDDSDTSRFYFKLGYVDEHAIYNMMFDTQFYVTEMDLGSYTDAKIMLLPLVDQSGETHLCLIIGTSYSWGGHRYYKALSGRANVINLTDNTKYMFTYHAVDFDVRIFDANNILHTYDDNEQGLKLYADVSVTDADHHYTNNPYTDGFYNLIFNSSKPSNSPIEKIDYLLNDSDIFSTQSIENSKPRWLATDYVDSISVDKITVNNPITMATQATDGRFNIVFINENFVICRSYYNSRHFIMVNK